MTCPTQRVTNLRPDDSEANPYWYTFKVQCTSCRETHANWVGVSRFVSSYIPLVFSLVKLGVAESKRNI